MIAEFLFPSDSVDDGGFNDVLMVRSGRVDPWVQRARLTPR